VVYHFSGAMLGCKSDNSLLHINNNECGDRVKLCKRHIFLFNSMYRLSRDAVDFYTNKPIEIDGPQALSASTNLY
jgi:hypothetical protein